MSGRIEARFARLRGEGRAWLVTFLTAGDPDLATSAELLAGLPAAGADLIEIGMPFTDPMADGPSIQAAGQRALKAGISMDRTFAMVRRFRAETRDFAQSRPRQHSQHWRVVTQTQRGACGCALTGQRKGMCEGMTDEASRDAMTSVDRRFHRK